MIETIASIAIVYCMIGLFIMMTQDYNYSLGVSIWWPIYLVKYLFRSFIEAIKS